MKPSHRHLRRFLLVAAPAAACLLGTAAIHPASQPEIPLEEANIFFEYNSTDNDLGVHVFLDGEDWKTMKITKPGGGAIFDVRGKGAYATFGMSELRVEGAEPTLDDVPLEDLLALFPEGVYEFEGKAAEGGTMGGEGALSHTIPAGPVVQANVGAGDFLQITWTPVTGVPPGFPARTVTIVGYEVIVGEEFDVHLPGTATSVTVSPEFVATLGPGRHKFEVLAIEASGNQTITESTFDR